MGFIFLDLSGKIQTSILSIRMSPIDSEILKELKNEDHSAFEEIFKRYSK